MAAWRRQTVFDKNGFRSRAIGPAEDKTVQGTIAELLAELTLEEKAALCSGRDFWHLKGIERLGIAPLMLTDGPHGLRKQREGAAVLQSIPATCFPTASTLACSWDRELLFEVGVALAEECRQEQVAVLLGPGINIKRSPLCGRNFEYFSEDPCLAGELAAALIEGLQSQGVGASLKHFAVNNQEHRRMTIDAVVDERSLREIYLAGFERAIKQARPWTVMCAYNRLGGTYCSEHQTLLTGILRDEWGYDGAVVSDWGACNDRVAALAAGLDVEMPGSGGVNDARIVAAVRAGTLDIAVLDRAVARVLGLIERCLEGRASGFRYSVDAHHALARRAQARSLVLLKNAADLLPLAPGGRVAVIGAFAATPRYQGAGSSQINPSRLDDALTAIRHYAPDCRYAPGYDMHADRVDPALMEQARALAMEADTIILFAGLPAHAECEGFDREHLDMPASHTQLLEALIATGRRLVLVLAAGAPVTLPGIERIDAAILAGLGGQAGGGAIADLLFGAVCPGGKLAETWPLALADTPAYRYFPGGPATVEYREALYVGYRYYDSFARPVLFPFGHGLSYTRFEYRALTLSATRMGEHETLRVGIELCNIGARFGSEVVQVYVRDIESTVFRPHQELRDFARVELAPGEVRRLEFSLDRRAFAFYDTACRDWRVESGVFAILIGASSADIRARGDIHIDAAPTCGEDLRARAPVYYPAPGESSASADRTAFEVSDAQFHALYGAVPPAPATAAYSLNSRLGDIKQHWLGALIYRAVLRASHHRLGAQRDPTLARMSVAMTEDMPLRLLVMFSGGYFRFGAAALLVALLNGRLLRELWRRCRGSR